MDFASPRPIDNNLVAQVYAHRMTFILPWSGVSLKQNQINQTETQLRVWSNQIKLPSRYPGGGELFLIAPAWEKSKDKEARCRSRSRMLVQQAPSQYRIQHLPGGRARSGKLSPGAGGWCSRFPRTTGSSTWEGLKSFVTLHWKVPGTWWIFRN